MEEKTEITESVDTNKVEAIEVQTNEGDEIKTPHLNRHQRRANAKLAIIGAKENARRQVAKTKREAKKLLSQLLQATNI